METKAELRQRLLQMRMQAFKENPQAALQLAEYLMPLLKNPGIVAAYYPIRYEISPLLILERLQAQGLITVLPVMPLKEEPLLFKPWNFGDPLQKNSLGFFEPSSRQPSFLDPDTLLVPLLAFDQQNNRLGYGRGDYDRTIEDLRRKKKITTIGLGYEIQGLKNLPRQDHDHALDYVVTEKKIHGL